MDKKQAKTYLDYVSNEIFGKEFHELEKNQKYTVRFSLVPRREPDGLDPTIHKELIDYICANME